MARTRGPLFSVEASGSIAGAITYQKSIKGFSCRRMPRHLDRKTAPQLAQRQRHLAGVRAWQDLLQTQKNIWIAYTDNDGNEGYHAFMSQYVHRTMIIMFQYELPPHTGYCLVGENLVGEFDVGGNWRDPAGAI
jgi:hypothetical protein